MAKQQKVKLIWDPAKKLPAGVVELREARVKRTGPVVATVKTIRREHDSEIYIWQCGKENNKEYSWKDARKKVQESFNQQHPD